MIYERREIGKRSRFFTDEHYMHEIECVCPQMMPGQTVRIELENCPTHGRARNPENFRQKPIFLLTGGILTLDDAVKFEKLKVYDYVRFNDVRRTGVVSGHVRRIFKANVAIPADAIQKFFSPKTERALRCIDRPHPFNWVVVLKDTGGYYCIPQNMHFLRNSSIFDITQCTTVKIQELRALWKAKGL